MDPPFNKKSILTVMTLTSFLTPFMASSVTVALPAIASSFHLSAIALSWISTAYLLATAIFLVPFGRLADIHGRRRVFMIGLWMYSIASLCAGSSFSGLMMIISRVLQGVGAAMILSTSTAILSAVFSAGERGKAFGYNVAAVYSGLSLGPFIGGFLIQQLGWHSIFLINVPLGLFLIVLTQHAITQEWSEAKGESFDFVGSILYGLTLLSLMTGFSLLPRIIGGIFVALSIVGIALFIWWGKDSQSPVFDIHLFMTNKVFAFSNLAALINYSATAAVAFLLSLYLHYIKGLTPQQVGFVLIAQPIVQAVISPFAGRLSDKLEPQVVASLGMAMTSIGLCALAFLSLHTDISMIVIILIVLGFGFALFSSPNTNAIMSAVEKQQYGIASSALATVRLTGQMFSMGITTLLFALFIGQVTITEEVFPQLVQSTKTAFAFFGVICGCGIFASLARGKMHKNNSNRKV
jgi:EmrB/QacA subfamily drug resistance transporter